MADMSKYIIKQMMPATGWYAVYMEEEEPHYSAIPLVGWALAEDEEGDSGVFGLDGGEYVDFAENMSNFLGYAHESQLEKRTPDWRVLALESLEAKARLQRHFTANGKGR